MYPFNWPLSKAFARMGVPLVIKVEVKFDEDEKVYIATSSTIKGLFIEGSSLDEIRREIELVLPQLVDINHGDDSLIARNNACLQINAPLHPA